LSGLIVELRLHFDGYECRRGFEIVFGRYIRNPGTAARRKKPPDQGSLSGEERGRDPQNSREAPTMLSGVDFVRVSAADGFVTSERL
jgi:hypothetical protein